MVLQAAFRAVALQDLALLVVLHANVAAEHALLRPAVGAVPLSLGHLRRVKGEEQNSLYNILEQKNRIENNRSRHFSPIFRIG